MFWVLLVPSCQCARPYQRECHIEAIQRSDTHVHDTYHACILVLFKASLLVHIEANSELQAVSDQSLRGGIIASPVN